MVLVPFCCQGTTAEVNRLSNITPLANRQAPGTLVSRAGQSSSHHTRLWVCSLWAPQPAAGLGIPQMLAELNVPTDAIPPLTVGSRLAAGPLPFLFLAYTDSSPHLHEKSRRDGAERGTSPFPQPAPICSAHGAQEMHARAHTHTHTHTETRVTLTPFQKALIAYSATSSCSRQYGFCSFQLTPWGHPKAPSE